MPEWRVQKNNSSYVDDLFDVEVVDTQNPFGSYGIAYVDDFEGTKRDDFPIGTRLDFEVKPDGSSSYQQRLTGFVVEPREVERQGADALEVEAYDVNHLLRRGTVREDVSGQSISSALQDIIEKFTPVTWNASKVSVEEDVQVTQNYRTERTENVIQSLLKKSTNERFWVDSSLEFNVASRETTQAPRGIDNSQWFDYDLPEDGTDKVNEVEVWYDDGNKVVFVDDSQDKKDLQDNLGTSKPVGFTEQIMRHKISDQDAARDAGRNRLQDLKGTQPYEVTTYGLSEADPGDVLPVRIVPEGIDREFRIAALAYRWGTDETTLTLIDNKGYGSDFNVRVSDTLKRVEMRIIGDEGEATETRIINTDISVLLDRAADIGGTNVRQLRVTNNLRNQIRDKFGDGGTVDVADLKVGTGDSQPTRLDDSLDNAVETVSVSQTTPASDKVQWTADFTTSEEILEFGLFDSSGVLLMRGIWGSGQSAGTLTASITVNNDSTTNEDAAATTNLQTLTRDIVANNSPNTPANYLVGDGSTSPTESDTSLGNQLNSSEIGNEIIQRASTTDEFQDVAKPGDDQPLTVDGGELKLEQSCWVREAENVAQAGMSSTSDSSYSNGEYITFDNSAGQILSFTISVGYDIPSGSAEIAVRNDTSDTYTMSIVVDGNLQDTAYNGSSGLSWDKITLSDGLPAGTHTIRIEGQSVPTETGNSQIDVVAVYDNRETYTFDNTVDGNGYLDGPELYPDAATLTFEAAKTQRKVGEATLSQTWNDTSNNQQLELSNDGGSNYISGSNTTSLTANFSSDETDVLTRVTLSRYGSASGQTPATGVNGQAIDSHTLFGDAGGVYPIDVGQVEVKTPIAPGTITGETLREGGQESSGSNLLTRSVYADVDVLSNQQITNIETVAWRDPGAVLAQAQDEFGVTITSTNSPVDSGQDLTVDVDVENTGDAQGTQTITLQNFDGNPIDTQDVTLTSGSTSSITLTWSTPSDLNETGTITVTSKDESDTAEVTVGDPPDENQQDGFEDGNVSEYTGCTDGSTIITSPVCEGTYALRQDSKSDGSLCAIYSTSGLSYPSAGDNVRYCVRADSSNVTAAFFFGVQAGSVADDNYRVDVNSNTEELVIYKNDGGTLTQLDSASISSFSTGVYGDVEVSWSDDGSFTARYFDDTDTKQAEVTTSETVYTSGGIGWGCSAAGVTSQVSAFFDDLRLVPSDPYIDTFEDADLDEYSNVTNATVSNSVPVSDGEYAAEVPSGDGIVYSLPGDGLGQDKYPEKGDVWKHDVYLESGAIARQFFGVQSGSPTQDHYRVRVDSGGGLFLDVVSGGTASTLASTSVTIPTDEYLSVYIDWGTVIEVVLRKSTGDEVDRINHDTSGDSTTYSSGGIGWGEGS